MSNLNIFGSIIFYVKRKYYGLPFLQDDVLVQAVLHLFYMVSTQPSPILSHNPKHDLSFYSSPTRPQPNLLRYYFTILNMIYPSTPSTSTSTPILSNNPKHDLSFYSSPTRPQPNLLRYYLTILNMIYPYIPLLHGLNPTFSDNFLQS